jgi:aminopeptidase-like protein
MSLEMYIRDLRSALQAETLGAEMHGLIRKLYPICRSITGAGLRSTLQIIKEIIPLEIHEVKTGTKVFDWEVPREWNITDAFVKDSSNKRVLDFQKSNLHVVNYSIPVHAKMRLPELKEHLFTLPEYPDWVPYRTSYYKEFWGFCLSHNDFLKLKEEEYEVCIDSNLVDGSLTYGEYLLAGELRDEMILFCHCCHPSLCNDNLSGIAVVAFLAKYLRTLPLRYSYRFVVAPTTIGSITWLALNEKQLSRIKHGLVVSNVGDPGRSVYKRSRQGNAAIDQAVYHVLKHSGLEHKVLDFSPYGGDERQFCSPGINLPVGRLTRTPDGRYPEYHTSADNLGFVKPQYLFDSLAKIVAVINLLENNKKCINQSPKCEPQLGKRGLYREMGGFQDAGSFELALLWVLNLSDGQNSLLDIAERANISFDAILAGAQALHSCGLLAEANCDEY